MSLGLCCLFFVDLESVALKQRGHRSTLLDKHRGVILQPMSIVGSCAMKFIFRFKALYDWVRCVFDVFSQAN
jgi:hypothetical protein